MKTQEITLERLAEKLNMTVWSKGDLKRIYLNDEGYNTNKMSTKTFIFEKEGEFIVSCHIECPSQPYQWIKSQEDEVKEGVYDKIENAIERILDSSIDAKEEIKNEAARVRWEAERIEIEKKEAQKEFIKAFEIGGKYSHPRFGEGEVISEKEETITLMFKGVFGEKTLVKKYSQLSNVK